MDRTQSMINALQKAEPDEFNQIRITVDARDLLVEMLKEQQPKKGNWIPTGYGHGRCSSCRQIVGNMYVSNYCPYCGTKMTV